MKRSTFAVLAIGGLTTLFFMLREGEPSRATWWLLFLPFEER